MTTALATLKKHLAGLVPPPTPGSETGGLTTGIDLLDAALPARGVPIGRLTELLGEQGSGKTTFLRHLVQTTLERKLWVAYVDASRTLAPRDWTHLDDGTSANRDSRPAAHSSEFTVRNPQSAIGLWMIRPASPSKGAWCADVLLRSGAFALVVLDGAPPLSRPATVRLTRLARSAGAALIVTGEKRGAAIPGALRLRCELRTTKGGVRSPTDPRYAVRSSQFAVDSQFAVRSSVSIVVEKGGIRRRIEVSYGVGMASRLCAHPEVPDRRGVGRKQAGGWKREAGDGYEINDRSSDSAPLPSSDHKQHPRGRARRCAESDFGREERSRGRIPDHEPKSGATVRGSRSTVRSSQLATRSITVRNPQSAIRTPTPTPTTVG